MSPYLGESRVAAVVVVHSEMQPRQRHTKLSMLPHHHHLLLLFLSTIVLPPPPPRSLQFGLAGNRDVTSALSAAAASILTRVLGCTNTTQLRCENARTVASPANAVDGDRQAAKAQRLPSACAARNGWLRCVREPVAVCALERPACLFGQSGRRGHSKLAGAAAADGLC